MKRLLLSAIVAVLALTGCQSNPVTGRKQLMLVSEDTAINESKQAYVAMLQPLAQQHKIDSDAATVSRVHEITGRLIAQPARYRPETEKWDWSVKVIDGPKTGEPWCMAGGKMAIDPRLLQQIQPTDDGVVLLMGHRNSH